MLTELLSDPNGLLKLMFVFIGTLFVFTQSFSSWPFSSRLVFALVVVSGAFVTCLTPDDLVAWRFFVQSIEAVFYTMISFVSCQYVYQTVFPDPNDPLYEGYINHEVS